MDVHVLVLLRLRRSSSADAARLRLQPSTQQASTPACGARAFANPATMAANMPARKSPIPVPGSPAEPGWRLQPSIKPCATLVETFSSPRLDAFRTAMGLRRRLPVRGMEVLSDKVRLRKQGPPGWESAGAAESTGSNTRNIGGRPTGIRT